MMALTTDTERVDTLLALALVASRSEADDPLRDGTSEGGSSIGSDAGALLSAPAPLSELRDADKQIVARRAAWYAGLAPEEQANWLRRTLSRVHNRSRRQVGRLDEHVHPSHVVESFTRRATPGSGSGSALPAAHARRHVGRRARHHL